MSNAKHTPGPWSAVFDKTATGIPFGIIVGASKGGKFDTVICHAPDYRDEKISFNSFKEANSRLIAAAPELLEQLQYVLRRIKESDEWWMDCPDRGGFDADAISAAIAKATGTAS